MATLFRRASKKINKDTTTPTVCTAASTAPRPLQASTCSDMLGQKHAGLKKGTIEQQAGAEHLAQSHKMSWQLKDKAPTYLHAPTKTSGMVKETFELEVSQNQP